MRLAEHIELRKAVIAPLCTQLPAPAFYVAGRIVQTVFSDYQPIPFAELSDQRKEAFLVTLPLKFNRSFLLQHLLVERIPRFFRRFEAVRLMLF